MLPTGRCVPIYMEYSWQVVRATARPANNPLHRTGYTQGRATNIPSALSLRFVRSGAFVRQPVSCVRWPARAA